MQSRIAVVVGEVEARHNDRRGSVARRNSMRIKTASRNTKTTATSFQKLEQTVDDG